MRHLLIAGLVLLVALLPARAEERILTFVSDVVVARNGDLGVTEQIRIEVEGDQIRHGIVRDFPTRYTDRRGASVIVGFTVQGVSRDGNAEPYSLEPLANGTRIRIGSADATVPHGPHDYVIRYRTTRQIGFFPDFDELTWNATGTDWTFPIDSAEARITLPEAVSFQNFIAYTGPPGSRDHAASVIWDTAHPGTVLFRTTEPLAVGSGLTVSASWQKGIVDPPSFERRARWWFLDNLGALAALAGSFLTLGYFFLAWLKVGRDPPRGPMVPLFSPPEGISAAAARYVSAMAFDNRAFTAALLDLGVHGRLQLADSGSTLVVSRQESAAPVGPPEADMEAALFRGAAAVPLEQKNHQVLQAAKAALSRGLARSYAGTIFHWNGGWLAIGMLLTALTYLLTGLGLVTAIGGDRGVQAIIGLLFASVAGIVVGIALNAGQTGQSLFSRLLTWIFLGAFAIAFGGSGVIAFVGTIVAPLDAAPLLLPAVVLPVLVSSFGWMRSPTAAGQKLRDAVAGFRHYLGTAEEHRLEILHPPEKTPVLFERYLPYAVALDVENAWAAKFAGVLATAGASAAVANWYVTSSHRDPSSLVDRLGSSLSQSVASASTAPGSSSGSSGGGSSGSGGGGGGGSGW
ncbi:DUF2207 domain-containing protein [Mesorhizobium sp. BR1-1-16]|uniref:DUF2207 domain-containing protein n=1 Tax=Mesorhizobium sp. BR1-1-16 TaxID=2876653 RepID=UPI001CCB0A52|nr:DUF2207 domain-containing protein [Mesorhizobium sp. BR1-1-16]MBZ9936518.1 DUF2207 domain-containing protein [Mesorhizobium sp. BR1-1-16]